MLITDDGVVLSNVAVGRRMICKEDLGQKIMMCD